MKRVSPLWWVGSLLMFAALIVAWQFAAELRAIPRAFFPAPQQTWAALVRGFSSGQLLADTATTLRRMALGWVLASMAGIALGVAIGLSAWARSYIAPMFEALRPLPASALAPVVMLFFGLTDWMILTLIAFGAVWPMLLTTVHGVSSVHVRKSEIARSLGLSRLAYAGKIAIPSALPDILGGLRLGLTVALILAVVGEMITVQGGLGAHILIAARRFNAADVFAGIAVLSAIGIATNLALTAFERRALRWQGDR